MRKAVAISIILVAAALRFAGLDFGLPHAEARPDEITIGFQAMKFGTGDLNPHSFNYPTLHKYLCFGLFGGHYVYGKLTGLYETKDDFLRAFFNGAVDFRLLMRVLSASLGTLTVVALMWAPGRLWSAALLSVAMLAVRDSHFGVTDTPMVAFAVLGVLLADRASQSGRTRDVVLAGVVCGLAASIKYNAALLGLPLACALLGKPGGSRATLIAAASMIGAFVLGSPYVVLDFSTFFKDFQYEANHLTTGHYVDVGGGWVHHVRTLLLTQGWAFVTLAGMGVIAALGLGLPDRRRAAVWLSFPLAYYLAIGKGETAFFRYILPVLPFACVAAGSLLARLPTPAAVLVGLGASLIPMWGSFHVNRLFILGDTRDSMADWIEQNVPAESVIIHGGAYTGAPMLQRNVANQTREYLAKQGRADSAGFRKPDDQRYYDLKRPMYDVLFVRKPGIDFVSQVDFDAGFTLAGAPVAAPFYLELEDYALTHYSAVPEVVRIYADNRCDIVHAAIAVRDAKLGTFDQQDALYLPAAGFSTFSRMGPNLTLYLCNTPAGVP